MTNTTPKEEWAQEFKDKFSLQLQGCHGKDSEALDLIRSVLLPNTEDHEA